MDSAATTRRASTEQQCAFVYSCLSDSSWSLAILTPPHSTMAPVRRTRTSTVTDVYPPTPPSAGDEDSDEYNPSSAEIEGRAGNKTKENSHWTVSFPSDPNTTQRTRVGSIMSTATPLQRGFACRSCRKRKLKCSGEKPVCEQCVKQNRAADCEYDDGRNRTRTQLLQEKIHRLEARIHELESSAGASSRATIAESAYPQAPNPLIHGSQGQSFEMSAPQDHRASNDNAFDFGSGTSPSAILSYEQLQLRETLNAVTGGKVPPEQHGPSPDWQQDVLPAHVQQQLLDIVLPHLASLGVDVNPQHFLQSLNLPSTHARRPHPSLLNALFLHACALSPPDHYLHPHQHRFLRSAVQAIAYSLEFADRLIDTLRAQCLVALWYIRAGRTLEAYNMISTAARFAVACELNRIVSPIFKPSPPSSEVGMDSNPSSPLHGIGIGIPRLAAIAATPATISGEPIALDGEGKIDAYRPITTGNFTHPRSISLGFGTGILPAWST
ncbi:hypothetical protein FRC14_007598 [Serendipita sp. 396]|nr:hypothetical protein FRC14_007598 [Serendipita sp. 396]